MPVKVDVMGHVATATPAPDFLKAEILASRVIAAQPFEPLPRKDAARSSEVAGVDQQIAVAAFAYSRMSVEVISKCRAFQYDGDNFRRRQFIEQQLQHLAMPKFPHRPIQGDVTDMGFDCGVPS